MVLIVRDTHNYSKTEYYNIIAAQYNSQNAVYDALVLIKVRCSQVEEALLQKPAWFLEATLDFVTVRDNFSLGEAYTNELSAILWVTVLTAISCRSC